jgi:hypothetical protein
LRIDGQDLRKSYELHPPRSTSLGITTCKKIA